MGTNGAVAIGLQYGLDKGYDWVWLFDADSVPHPGALEKLLAAFNELPSDQQEKVCFLASRVISGAEHHPMIFSDAGKPTRSDLSVDISRCDCALQAGSLYRLAAVLQIGLPNADYVLDWGELEYGYWAWCAGFKSFVIRHSVWIMTLEAVPEFLSAATGSGRFSFPTYIPHQLDVTISFERNIFWLYECKHLQD